MMNLKEIPVIGNQPIGRCGINDVGWPVLEIFNKWVGIGRGQDIAFDDTVVEKAVGNICHDKACFA